MKGVMEWLKLWNEAPDDPKWLAIADMAGSSPAVVWTTFSKSLTHANQNEPRGSITGLHPQVVASWCRVPIDEVRRIFQAFRDLGILIGDRVAKWTKRQTEKLVKPRSADAERQARHRAKAAAAAAQGTLDLAVTPVTPASPALLSSVTSAAEEEGESLRIPPDYLINTESTAARQGDFKGDEGIPFGRDAPLEQPPVSNVVAIEGSASLKDKKKEMRRQKVMRFISATYSGEESERRWAGMLGADPNRDEQWWFDKCDAEMRMARWDDVRDKAEPLGGWQPMGSPENAVGQRRPSAMSPEGLIARR